MNNLPEDVLNEAERLTHLARAATDPTEATAYRDLRKTILTEHDYAARVRQGQQGDVLVCYPRNWVEDGTVQIDQITDLDRGIERHIDQSDVPSDWGDVNAHNQAIVTEIRATVGNVHGANVSAFADYMGNHHVKRMESATEREIDEFLAEYFPRNSWPSDAQRDCVTDSIRIVFEWTDEPLPPHQSQADLD